MGIGIFRSSSCACESPSVIEKVVEVVRSEQPSPPANPNPRNFKLLKVEEVGKFIIAMVQYPDCDNYEGVKILVFHNLSQEQLLNATFLDPHFCNGSHYAPIARFRPGPDGMECARLFCKAVPHA